VQIRVAAETDAAVVRAIYAPVIESSATSFELEVPSVAEMGARITTRQPAHPWLVIEDETGVQGYAYAGRFSGRPAYDWSVETSIYLAPTARGRGVGAALYTALLQVLAAQGYRQAMAGISLPNAASVALHEGLGFAPVGVYRAVGWKFETWHDVGWWQRGLGGPEAPPHGPVALTALPAETLDAAFRAGPARLRRPAP
jgi:phosphinothricin acetyltransferase